MTLLEPEQMTRRNGGKDGALQDWVRALEATAPIAAQPRRLLVDLIHDMAQTRGEAPALISADEGLTYRQLSERANRYARWALAREVGKGDTVALIMPNRPEYLAIWLGITSVGAVVALINTQLRGPSLAHCIDIVAPKHIIVASGEIEAFASAAESITTRATVWSHGDGGARFGRTDREVERHSGAPLTPAERRDVTIEDRALAIYTSGTTGLPKAANVSHRRLLQWSLWFAGLMDTTAADRMYDCLPLYHSIGGVVATGALLARGGSVVIREKFSASAFWDDIRAFDCTLFQYIGELCRYLVSAPAQPHERDHRLRLCAGNGLRGEVWEKFQARFGIPRILEFYAATEGNVSLYNVEGKPGAIGRVPSFLAHRFPLALVQFDHATGAPVRDRDGRCIRCARGETGEAIGKIGDDKISGGAFEGYTTAADSERKILRDVFARGDAWYRTGDLMRMDAGGFYVFVDRIGDTFRWKGENVATSDVADALTAFPGIVEAAVYGVKVGGTEGAAGMAALVVDERFDLAALHAHLRRRLPAYARPLFLRIAERIAATATFKQQKAALAKDGYDPAATTDAIYFDDPALGAYRRLDAALLAQIEAGELRL